MLEDVLARGGGAWKIVEEGDQPVLLEVAETRTGWVLTVRRYVVQDAGWVRGRDLLTAGRLWLLAELGRQFGATGWSRHRPPPPAPPPEGAGA